MHTHRWGQRAFSIALFLVFCVVVLGPVVAALTSVLSLAEGTGASGILHETRQWILLFRTVLVAAGTALLATLLGAPVGFFLAYEAGRGPLPGRRGLAGVLSVPLLLPPYIMAVAWIELLGNNGVITRFLRDAVGSADWLDIYTVPGIILVLGLTYYPIVAVATAVAVRRLDGRLEEAALLAGGKVRMFMDVTLPLMMPTILTGTGAVFLLTLLNFSVPSLLQVQVYTVEIFTRFNSFYDPGGAMRQSVPLLVVGGALLVLWMAVLRPRVGRLSGVHRPRPVATQARLFRAVGLAYCALLATFSVGLPLAVLVARAMPMRSFIDAWSTAREEIITTVMLAGISATAGVAFAFALACVGKAPRLACASTPFRKVYLLSAVPFLLSGPILGVGLIRVWNHHGFPGAVYDSFVIIVLACVGRYLVFGHFGLRIALDHISPCMEEAAAVSGAGPWRRVRGIVLPLMRPAMVATWGLLFVLAMGELDTVLLVCPPGWTPLSVRLFSLMHYGPSQLVAALCVITAALILCGAGLAGLAYLGRRRFLHEGS